MSPRIHGIALSTLLLLCAATRAEVKRARVSIFYTTNLLAELTPCG